jgi:hypothetical protein
MSSASQREDWSYRPDDMDLRDDPVFMAEVVLLARAEKVAVRAIELATRAREEANAAIGIYQSALWDLAEARD